MNFKNKSLLITGGTGSFGKFFIEHILKQKNLPKRLIILSRDELKQFEWKNIKNIKILKY